VEVGLVGIAPLGGDLGCAEAGGQLVGGIIEADQRGRALGREADLGPEPRPETLPASPGLTGQCVDPDPTAAGDDALPRSGHLRMH
jgi:hypothetical protein